MAVGANGITELVGKFLAAAIGTFDWLHYVFCEITGLHIATPAASSRLGPRVSGGLPISLTSVAIAAVSTWTLPR